MIACQGFLTIPSETSNSTSISSAFKLPPKGTYYSLLHQENGCLALHRGNPYHVSEEKEEDGEEIARIHLFERGWNQARKVGEDVDTRAFELIQEKVAVRKGSSGIGFAQSIALKLKRSKSISMNGQPLTPVGKGGVSSTNDVGFDTVEPLMMYADDAIQAAKWIEAFNKTLSLSATNSPSLSSNIPLSPSLSFASFSLQGSRRPSKPSPSLATIPLLDPASPRPSFLNHLPQSPRSYQVTLTEPSPPPKRRQSVAIVSPLSASPSSSNVPDWISSVKTSTSNPSPSFMTSPQLKSKLSITSITSVPEGPTSTSMQRNRSDGRSSVDSRGSGGSSGSKRLFGFLSSRKPKKDVDGLDATLANFSMTSTSPRSPTAPPLSGRLLSPSQNYNPTSSTVSLSESLLSELHASSLYSSDMNLPFTPNLLGSLGLDNIPLSPPPSATIDYNDGFLPQPEVHQFGFHSNSSIISRQSNLSNVNSIQSLTSRNPPPFFRTRTSSSSVESRSQMNKISSDLISLDSHTSSDNTRASQDYDVDLDVTEFTGIDKGTSTQILIGSTGTRRISTSRNNTEIVGGRRRNGMLVEEDDVNFNLDLPRFTATSAVSSTSTTTAAAPCVEYIIKPQDLIAQMSNESAERNYSNGGFSTSSGINATTVDSKTLNPRTPHGKLSNSTLNRLPHSSSTQTLSSYNYNGGTTSTKNITSSPSMQLLGGLSPRTTSSRSDSRQNLNLLLASSSPTSSNFNNVNNGNSRSNLNLNSPVHASNANPPNSKFIPRSNSTSWFDAKRSVSSSLLFTIRREEEAAEEEEIELK